MDGENHGTIAGSADAGPKMDHSLIDQLPDALIVHVDGEVVFANRRAAELFRVPAAAGLLGHRLEELVHPDDRGRAALDRTPATEATAAHPDIRFIDLENGGELRADSRWSPIRWKGRAAGLICLQPRPDAADGTVPLRDRLIAVVDNAPFTFALKDLEGKYLAANREYLRLRGKSLDEIVGRRADEIYSSDIAMLMGEMDRWLMDAGRPVTVELALNDDYVDEGFRELTKFPIFSDAGEIVAIGGVGIDTTRRRQSEVALQHRENFLSAILESTVDGIVTIAEDGTIETMNRSAQAMFGYDADDIVGQPVARLMAEPFGRQHMDYLESYVRTGRANIIGVRREVTGRKADETEFPVELAIVEVVGIDGVRGFVGALRDLSARKALENQLHHAQKMESIGRLTGGIAHDFNNLLTVVGINSRLLLQKLGDSTQLEMADSISRSAERGAALVRQLLAYSRQSPLRPELLDLRAAMSGVRGLLERTLPSTVRIRCGMPPDLRPIRVDRTQFETALLNVILNACDAMPDGGRLRIDATEAHLTEATPLADGAELAAGRYLVVAVADSGVGIPDDAIDQVFDPFFTTKGVGEGSGLGLSMVYGFARQSGGGVTIDSEVGIGTTVRLYLPEAADSEVLVADAPKQAATGELPTARPGETVLVVEDDDDLRVTIAGELEKLGYAVFQAATAVAAQSALRGEAGIDILLIDLVLSGVTTGKDVSSEARLIDPDQKVLFMSGHPDRAHSLLDDAEERTRLMEKPFSLLDLARTLRAVLDGA